MGPRESTKCMQCHYRGETVKVGNIHLCKICLARRITSLEKSIADAKETMTRCYEELTLCRRLLSKAPDRKPPCINAILSDLEVRTVTQLLHLRMAELFTLRDRYGHKKRVYGAEYLHPDDTIIVMLFRRIPVYAVITDKHKETPPELVAEKPNLIYLNGESIFTSCTVSDVLPLNEASKQLLTYLKIHERSHVDFELIKEYFMSIKRQTRG